MIWNIFFFSENQPNMNTKLQELRNIKDRIYEYSSKFNVNPRLHIRYVYNGCKNTTTDMNHTINTFKKTI